MRSEECKGEGKEDGDANRRMEEIWFQRNNGRQEV